MKAIRYVLSAFIFLAVSGSLYAGIDVNVYEDTVYLYLDKLYAAGLIKTYMPNQRPLSRYIIAKLAAEARQNATREHAPLDSIIRELEAEFSDALQDEGVRFVPLDSLSLSYTATNQEASPVPDNGLGITSGLVQPLLSYEYGHQFEKHSNAYFSSVHSLKAGPHFAGYLQPELYARSGESDNAGISLFRGYAKVGFGDFELQVGRDDVQWGPGENALFFSGNARALDMVRVSSPAPFQFPGFFKHLGHFKGTAFVSWLGSDYNPEDATLSGYRLDYSPFRWVNIGFDHAVFLGGAGAKNPSAGTAIKEFIGFISQSGNDSASSNHLMGADANFRIQKAMGMELYVKVLLEDTQAERGYMLKNDASWLGGVYFPKFRGVEKLSVRGEFIYTGQFAYRHGFYADGFSLDHKFIGYDAASDTYSGVIASRYQINFDEYVKVDFRYLQRSSDHYRPVYSDSGNNNGIIKDIDGPEEGNTILRFGGQKKLSNATRLYAEVGYDRRSNADFVIGKSANDFSFQIELNFRK